MDALKSLAKELVRLVRKGTNLIEDELPEVARQILRFKKIEGCATIGACLVGMVIANLIAVYLWPHASEHHGYFDDGLDVGMGKFFISICALILNSIMAAGICDAGKDLIQLFFAPRVYLIEYLRGML